MYEKSNVFICRLWEHLNNFLSTYIMREFRIKMCLINRHLITAMVLWHAWIFSTGVMETQLHVCLGVGGGGGTTLKMAFIKC